MTPQSIMNLHLQFTSLSFCRLKYRLMADERSPDTVNKARKVTQKELSKIEEYLSLIEREIERILLAQRILERNLELMERNLN